MKIFFIFSFFFILICEVHSQKNVFTIRIPAELVSHSTTGDSIRESGIKINDKSILWDTAKVSIKTHYPDFDTIHYFGQEIISRFHPGEKYMMVQSCCMSFDFLPESRAIPFNKGNSDSGFDEVVFDSLRALYYDDFTLIRFRFKQGKYFKDLGAYFPDHAAMPYLILLEHSSSDSWYRAPKGWYRNNISTLAFVDMTDSLKMELAKHDSFDRKDIVEDVYLFGDQLHSLLSYRFFHGEKLEIEYDPRKKKITRLRIID